MDTIRAHEVINTDGNDTVDIKWDDLVELNSRILDLKEETHELRAVIESLRAILNECSID